MATSSAMSTTNDKIKYKITITQNSQSVANNTSNVTVSVRVYRTNTGYTTYGTGTVYCTINGTQYTEAITSSDKITSSGIVLFSKTLNIAHSADGTKTLATSARITHDQFSSSSQSYSQALTTIPRATTPTLSASSVNMGASITINMPRASSSFDHTLTYKFGSASGTIGSDLGTSKAWTVPLSLASQIPNGTSGTCTITCKTYNGSTLIGTKTVSFTAKVPSSVVPSIGSVAVADTNATYATQFGSLVQGKSKAKFTITASGAYGSTITAYKTVIEGKTYTGATPTTSVLTGSGNVTATVTVTDSRGRTATTEKTFNRIPYSAPKITVFKGVRTDTEGTENYEGTNAKITVVFSIASASNKNTSSFKLEYKAKSTTTWTTLESGSGYSYNDSIITESVFDTNSAYDVRLTVTDFFGNISKIIDLPTAFTLLDFNSSGRAMAFGKVSEKAEGIEFNLPLYSGHPGKILWSGTWYMTAGHTANLSEKISEQMYGIVIVFSRIGDGVAQNDNFASFFVPKYVVAQHPGLGMNFFMAHSSFEYCGAKYLYISDQKIVGHANNSLVGTGAVGIKFENNRFIMRYVIGV